VRYGPHAVGEVLRRWLSGSYANVAATLALVVALGGTAIAAGGLPGKNSVFSSDIKDRQVKAPDVRRGAVTGKAVAANSIVEGDLAFLETNRVAMNDSTPDDGEYTIGSVVYSKGGVRLRVDCREEGVDRTTRIMLVANQGVAASFNAHEFSGPIAGQVSGSQATLVEETSTDVYPFAIKVAQGPFLTGSVLPTSGGSAGDCETTIAVSG